MAKRRTLREIVEGATGESFAGVVYSVIVDAETGDHARVPADELELVFDSGEHATGDYETTQALVLEHPRQRLLLALHLARNSLTRLDGQYEPELVTLSELRHRILNGAYGIKDSDQWMDEAAARSNDRGRIGLGNWITQHADRFEGSPSGWIGKKPDPVLPDSWPAWHPGEEAEQGNIQRAANTAKAKKATKAAERAARRIGRRTGP